MGQDFIGVYATSEKAPSLGEFPRPMAKRKRLWFVWKTPEGKYKAQVLNAVHQPMAAPRIISSREFEDRFVVEPYCEAVPEGYVRPDMAVDSAAESLPDLFIGTPPAPFAPSLVSVTSALDSLFPDHPPEDGDKLNADDPHLLVAWVKAEPRSKRVMALPTIPFDRLVDEVVGFAGEAGAGNALQAPLPVAEEPEQMRVLRSQFIQALLLLRRGEREDSITLLHEMFTQEHLFFEGGAQLFSEFGLGLRRLGLISLALAAHKRALEFVPRDERVLFNIARTYHDLGHLSEAREYLEESLAVAPEFVLARQFLAFLVVDVPKGEKAQEH